MAAASHSSRMPDLSASLNDSHSCAPLSDLWNLPQSAMFPMHDTDSSIAPGNSRQISGSHHNSNRRMGSGTSVLSVSPVSSCTSACSDDGLDFVPYEPSAHEDRRALHSLHAHNRGRGHGHSNASDPNSGSTNTVSVGANSTGTTASAGSPPVTGRAGLPHGTVSAAALVLGGHVNQASRSGSAPPSNPKHNQNQNQNSNQSQGQSQSQSQSQSQKNSPANQQAEQYSESFSDQFTGSPGSVATSSLWARSPSAQPSVSSSFLGPHSGRRGFRPGPQAPPPASHGPHGSASTVQSSSQPGSASSHSANSVAAHSAPGSRGIWAPRDEISYPPRHNAHAGPHSGVFASPVVSTPPALDRPSSQGHWLSQNSFKSPPLGHSLGMHGYQMHNSHAISAAGQNHTLPLGSHGLPVSLPNQLSGNHGISGLHSVHGVHAPASHGTPHGLAPHSSQLAGPHAAGHGMAGVSPGVNIPGAVQGVHHGGPPVVPSLAGSMMKNSIPGPMPSVVPVPGMGGVHVSGTIPGAIPGSMPVSMPVSAHSGHKSLHSAGTHGPHGPHSQIPHSAVAVPGHSAQNHNQSAVSPVGDSQTHHLRAPKKSGRPSTNTELYKTELCASYTSTGGNCPYGEKCQFAHGMQELKTVDRPPKWRSKPCQNWIRTGSCSYNERCCFRHDIPLNPQ